MERHKEILNEVLDEIQAALKDQNGLLAHQRRLAFLLSLGAENLLEVHFHNLDVMKEGSKIDHRWFKKKQETIFEHLQRQITSPINSIEHIHKIIDIITKIEEKRDDIAYGTPTTEETLQEKINLFFDLKKIVKC